VLHFEGLRKKVIKNHFIIIIIMVILFEGMFMFYIQNNQYESVRQLSKSQIKYTTDWTYKTDTVDTTSFETKINNIFERQSLDKNSKFGVSIIDKNRRIILDQYGFKCNEKVYYDDVERALKDSKASVPYTYKIPETGEHVMSISAPLKSNNTIEGVVRYTTSLDELDNAIAKQALWLALAGILILLIAVAISLKFAETLINPLSELKDFANELATGNYKVKLKHSAIVDDEIGELAQTFEHMAYEIDKSEKLKEEFISSISHELRTPLTSIKGWAIVLESSDLEDKEEVREGLKIIESEVERLTYLVEELLDFSKLISGKITLRKEVVNVDEFTQYILRQLEPKLLSRGIDVEFKSGEVKPIEVDKNRMKQVLINILDNAIKFSPNDSKIVISIMEDNKYLTISIKDHGYGISKEDLLHVKEKFYKGRNINASNGIGLSICDEIITQHEGILEIKSGLQKGTEVIIMLPKGEKE